jgi:hypothetical protein
MIRYGYEQSVVTCLGTVRERLRKITIRTLGLILKVLFVIRVIVVSCGLVVVVHAIRPKFRGFKPSLGRWIFKGDMFRSTTSFQKEVKPSAPCRKILPHVEDPFGV